MGPRTCKWDLPCRKVSAALGYECQNKPRTRRNEPRLNYHSSSNARVGHRALRRTHPNLQSGLWRCTRNCSKNKNGDDKTRRTLSHENAGACRCQNPRDCSEHDLVKVSTGDRPPPAPHVYSAFTLNKETQQHLMVLPLPSWIRRWCLPSKVAAVDRLARRGWAQHPFTVPRRRYLDLGGRLRLLLVSSILPALSICGMSSIAATTTTTTTTPAASTTATIINSTTCTTLFYPVPAVGVLLRPSNLKSQKPSDALRAASPAQPNLPWLLRPKNFQRYSCYS